MTNELILYISIFINIILIYGIYNVFRKYGMITQKLFDYEDKIVDIFIQFKKSYDNIIRLDKKGVYSTDDEVGFSFEILKRNFVDLANLSRKIVLTEPKKPQNGKEKIG